jgi:hypothetical protein
LGIGKRELVAQRFQDRGQRLPIVIIQDVDQKQNGQCRSNRFGSHWPSTLPHRILISLSFISFGAEASLKYSSAPTRVFDEVLQPPYTESVIAAEPCCLS